MSMPSHTTTSFKVPELLKQRQYYSTLAFHHHRYMHVDSRNKSSSPTNMGKSSSLWSHFLDNERVLDSLGA
jgi:hypothetical protein